MNSHLSYSLLAISLGDAGETKQQWSGFRGQGTEKGHHSAGRWRGVHHDREEGAVARPLSPLSDTAALLLPDAGQYRYTPACHCVIVQYAFIVGVICARGNEAQFYKNNLLPCLTEENFQIKLWHKQGQPLAQVVERAFVEVHCCWCTLMIHSMMHKGNRGITTAKKLKIRADRVGAALTKLTKEYYFCGKLCSSGSKIAIVLI